LDEVDDRQLVRLVGYLNAYLRKCPDLTVVVCSRIVEYQPLKDNKETRLQLEGAVTFQPLNPSQIASYLEKAKAISLRDALSKDPGLAELAQTPLTLSMMTLAYGGVAPTDIPANISLVERRRHLFDTYIDRMMQRKARRDRGIPFDLNPDNDVQEREYPYTREQVNRYLGWLAVRLSERMQTVFPLDRLYSFLAQEPENKGNQKFWTEVKLTNAVFIVLSIIALTILLMPKTLDGIKQAALIFSFLLPSSLFLSFVTNRTFSKNFPANKLIKYSMIALTIISIASLIVGAFGGLVSSLAVALPFAVSPLALGAIVATAIMAILYITPRFNTDITIYLVVTGGSFILPLTPVLLGQATTSLDVGIAVSMVTAQLIFYAVKLYQEDEEIFFELLYLSAFVAGVTLVVWLGITSISTLDWYETIIILGLSLGIFWGTLKKNLRALLVVIVLAALIGGWVANAVGGLVGASAVLSIIGLTFYYKQEVGEQFIKTIESSIAYLTDRLLYNPILKFLLTIHRSIPANCNRLLNYGISALLLKKVGREYEFVHRLLRDHFAIRELVPTLGDNAELEQRLQSIQQLSFQGESAFDTLAALAQDENPRIREAAIQGLGRVAIPEVVPLLQTALEDSSIQVRKTVIDSLSKLPKKDSKKLLSKALQDSVLSVQLLSISRMLRYEWGQALSQIIATTPLAQIIEALQERDEGVRQVAAEALGVAGNNEAVPSLAKALHDENAGVRSTAAAALGQIGDRTVVPDLLNALRDRNDSVRGLAAEALGRIGDRTAVPDLLKALRDRNDWVSGLAAEALGRIGDRTAVPDLLKALRDRDYWVRYNVKEALRQIGTPEALNALKQNTD